MTLKAVIFDVDGTLADMEEAHRQAFNAAVKKFGLPWHWDAEHYVELLAVAGGLAGTTSAVPQSCWITWVIPK